jgi:hypothetical protein
MDKMKEIIKCIKEQENLPEMQEEKLFQTISTAKQTLHENILEGTVSYFEFLFIQAGFIKKRWWLFQAVILVLLWGKLFVTQNPAALYRDASVLIPVFVILIIPELWKNIRTKSWEIENSAFYTLRQVYSARLLLFGIADLLLFSIFFTTTAITMQITLYDMIIQCILPFNLTCCICFGILCSRRFRSEYTAISFCMIGAAIWHQIVINGKLYASVSEAVWLAILGLSGVYLVFAIHRLMSTCAEYCEVNVTWN